METKEVRRKKNSEALYNVLEDIVNAMNKDNLNRSQSVLEKNATKDEHIAKYFTQKL